MNLRADFVGKQFCRSENGIDNRISHYSSEKELVKLQVSLKIAVK